MTISHPLTWLERAPGERPAVADGDHMLSYAELTQRAARMGHRIFEAQGSGRYFLVPAARNVEFVCQLVACWYSGNIPVPVDPSAPRELLEELGTRCGEWSHIGDIDFSHWQHVEPLDRRNGDLPALVLFTSGTSGVPKGVPVSVSNLHHSAATISQYLGYAEHPSAAVVLPLHYSYALLSQVLCMFYVGGYARIFTSFRNPIQFAEAVQAERLETFCGVPSTYQALLTMQKLVRIDMGGVRVVCSAGAAFDRSCLPDVKSIFPNGLFFDNYGMTEATPRVSFIREDDPRFAEATCGRAIDGMALRIFSDGDLAPLPDGQTGIVGVKGPNVFAGYLNDAEATARVFTPDGFLLSGDIGYLDDGYLFVRGRRDEVFNVGGEKVSPLEIEHVLSKHCAVEACAVAAFEDKRRGTVPVAYVVLREKAAKQDLVTFLRDRLPATKVPWRFFEVSRLPMTPNGKLQRRKLAPDQTEYVSRELV